MKVGDVIRVVKPIHDPIDGDSPYGIVVKVVEIVYKRGDSRAFGLDVVLLTRAASQRRPLPYRYYNSEVKEVPASKLTKDHKAIYAAWVLTHGG